MERPNRASRCRLQERDRASAEALVDGESKTFRGDEIVISAGALVKRSGEQMHGEPVELVARHHTGSDKSPYERLIGDAVRACWSRRMI